MICMLFELFFEIEPGIPGRFSNFTYATAIYLILMQIKNQAPINA